MRGTRWQFHIHLEKKRGQIAWQRERERLTGSVNTNYSQKSLEYTSKPFTGK